MRLVIIGGSDAGISAALRARELDRNIEIFVVLADEFPNYSICGLPFFLSGETPDAKQLAHRTEFEGIRLVMSHLARSLDLQRKVVVLEDQHKKQTELQYDRLIIGTGAEPVVPPIAGVETEGVFPLHTMDQSFALQKYLEERSPKTAIIVGAGYIGVEMADALTVRGLKVTLIGKNESILPTVDFDLGRKIEEEFGRHGVEVITGTEVRSIVKHGPRLRLTGQHHFTKDADVVITAVGVRPASDLARNAGLAVGGHGAIRVDLGMRTAVENVYAAGDCAETWHRLLGGYTYLPLGTTSHKQGRIAGENAVGGDREFQGSVGTQVVKIFDLAVARTGLRESELKGARFDPFTSAIKAWDHKAYYPGARELTIRITGDRRSGQLLGAQIVGHWQAQVAKRIDIFAAALFAGMKVDAINDLDLSYTPPLGSPWDAVQLAAQAWNSARTEESRTVAQPASD